MSAQTWTGVRERVLELGWMLRDPLTADELADLERYCGVRLPEEYRDFLLHVGAGGAGPAYGVYPARRGPDGAWAWHGDGADMTLPTRLAEPFPVDRVDPAVLDALLDDQPDEEEYDDEDEFDAANDAWEERMDALLWTDEATVGAICLSTVGCAQRQWLVVSGPERGNMWDDPRCDDADLEPMGVTFVEWYLDWLENASRGAGQA